tara:strand:+ start:8565 stop:8840 length:276 start_codon:yes stop_codon:yes gene_type:complete
MHQSGSKLLNKFGELLSDTAGAASGLKKEIEVLVRSQVERILMDFDLVQRDEFDAIKEMLTKERNKNDELEKKLKDIEKLVKQKIKDKSKK